MGLKILYLRSRVNDLQDLILCNGHHFLHGPHVRRLIHLRDVHHITSTPIIP